jgi:hypothetical protein
MGDYSIKVSYSLDGSLRVFSGSISFNDCAILSGKGERYEGEMKKERELKGIITLDSVKARLNFLKIPVGGKDFSLRVIEFQTQDCPIKGDITGVYTGAWRYRSNLPGNISPSSGLSDCLWLRKVISVNIWINQNVIKERNAIIELFPLSQTSLEQTLNTHSLI